MNNIPAMRVTQTRQSLDNSLGVATESRYPWTKPIITEAGCWLRRGVAVWFRLVCSPVSYRMIFFVKSQIFRLFVINGHKSASRIIRLFKSFTHDQ